jgi:hypothetical protein
MEIPKTSLQALAPKSNAKSGTLKPVGKRKIIYCHHAHPQHSII